jgi:hypothetical protein
MYKKDVFRYPYSIYYGKSACCVLRLTCVQFTCLLHVRTERNTHFGTKRSPHLGAKQTTTENTMGMMVRKGWR